MRHKVSRDQYLEAQHIARDIDIKINARIRFIHALALSITQEQIEKRTPLAKLLRERTELTNFFKQGIVVVRPDGSGLIAEYPEMPDRRDLVFSNSVWFQRAKQAPGVFISGPFRGQSSGEPIVAMAMAIRNHAGKVLGVLATPIVLKDQGFLGYVYNKQYRPVGDVLVVSRGSRLFVASSKGQMVLSPTPAPGTNALHDKAMAGYNGAGTTINAFGVEEISAMADVASLDWFVVVQTPSDIVFAPLLDRLKTNFGLGFLLVFAVVACIYIVLHIYFTPLKNAAQIVREMLPGDGLKKLPHTRNDEIGDLITGFNSLVTVVNERTAALEQAKTDLEKLSRIDALTGVFNRRWFDDSLVNSWRTSQRSGRPLSLIMLDIDLFKDYNDSYGHQQGDACLAEVAGELKKMLRRPSDTFVRYGGEEFAAIVDNDATRALKLAESMCNAIECLGLEHRASPYGIVTISLGVATLVPSKDASPDVLVAQADKALYESKAKGRNRVEAYSSG